MTKDEIIRMLQGIDEDATGVWDIVEDQLEAHIKELPLSEVMDMLRAPEPAAPAKRKSRIPVDQVRDVVMGHISAAPNGANMGFLREKTGYGRGQISNTIKWLKDNGKIRQEGERINARYVAA